MWHTFKAFVSFFVSMRNYTLISNVLHVTLVEHANILGVIFWQWNQICKFSMRCSNLLLRSMTPFKRSEHVPHSLDPNSLIKKWLKKMLDYEEVVILSKKHALGFGLNYSTKNSLKWNLKKWPMCHISCHFPFETDCLSNF
jgi:hypothetical protein